MVLLQPLLIKEDALLISLISKSLPKSFVNAFGKSSAPTFAKLLQDKVKGRPSSIFALNIKQTIEKRIRSQKHSCLSTFVDRHGGLVLLLALKPSLVDDYDDDDDGGDGYSVWFKQEQRKDRRLYQEDKDVEGKKKKRWSDRISYEFNHNGIPSTLRWINIICRELKIMFGSWLVTQPTRVIIQAPPLPQATNTNTTQTPQATNTAPSPYS